jgi:hypothetical protein
MYVEKHSSRSSCFGCCCLLLMHDFELHNVCNSFQILALLHNVCLQSRAVLLQIINLHATHESTGSHHHLMPSLQMQLCNVEYMETCHHALMIAMIAFWKESAEHAAQVARNFTNHEKSFMNPRTKVKASYTPFRACARVSVSDMCWCVGVLYCRWSNAHCKKFVRIQIKEGDEWQQGNKRADARWCTSAAKQVVCIWVD